jgi:uncharacterized membrane protein affecting hemolysin expression
MTMSMALTNLPPVTQPKPTAALRRAGEAAAAVLCLAILVLLAVATRVFVFQHFHGDSHVVDGLLQLLGRGLGL